MEAGCVASARNLLRWAFADWANGGHRLCTRFEFKSKAVVHFGQDKTLIASASLADNGAMHTVAINTLTVFDVVHDRFRLGRAVTPSGVKGKNVVCRATNAKCKNSAKKYCSASQRKNSPGSFIARREVAECHECFEAKHEHGPSRPIIPARKCVILLSVALRSHSCQLALRTSVSSISVTVIWPGAACSITSAATISTTGATGRFTFRATFFTGARLGLALATVRFAALAALRTLLRLAEFALRSLARPCTFDPFLRLAMIHPGFGWCAATRIDARSSSPGN